MSTATVEVLVPPPGLADLADPFRYGRRYVLHDRGDGNITVEQIPLTLEDVLHPGCGAGFCGGAGSRG